MPAERDVQSRLRESSWQMFRRCRLDCEWKQNTIQIALVWSSGNCLLVLLHSENASETAKTLRVSLAVR